MNHHLRTRQALIGALQRTRAAWEKAKPAVRAAFENDRGVARARFVRAMDLLKPHRKGQDRLLSPLSLAARYGLPAVRAGLESLDCLRPAHHLVRLGGENPRPPEDAP